MSAIITFDQDNFIPVCDVLAAKDADLASVINTFGYPHFWHRPANFETLIHIILEQQVSLASARAAMMKLQSRIVMITPDNLLKLTDDELKQCYFSRQKIIYARHLATVILSGQLNLDALPLMHNSAVRTALLQVKGIGNWTADVYLMMVLQRPDILPLGDIALIKSIKEVKHLPGNITKTEIAAIASAWQPWQTIASFILWHAYLCKRKRVV